MEITEEYLKEKLKLVTDTLEQAREQTQKWDLIAKQNEGAVNTINYILKDMQEVKDKVKDNIKNK